MIRTAKGTSGDCWGQRAHDSHPPKMSASMQCGHLPSWCRWFLPRTLKPCSPCLCLPTSSCWGSSSSSSSPPPPTPGRCPPQAFALADVCMHVFACVFVEQKSPIHPPDCQQWFRLERGFQVGMFFLMYICTVCHIYRIVTEKSFSTIFLIDHLSIFLMPKLHRMSIYLPQQLFRTMFM